MKNQYLYLLCFVISCFSSCKKSTEDKMTHEVLAHWSTTEIQHADVFLLNQPITPTSSYCERSEGGVHDFFSEGDYWWPDEKDTSAPYIRKDGLSNPNVFSDHRHALVDLSEQVATLSSAWLITEEQKYIDKVQEHLTAWFVDTATMMSPHMLYAQAIYGRYSGRGIGLIDAYHFVEIVRAIDILEAKGALDIVVISDVKAWFSTFLSWMMTHPYGVKEMNTKNNHATCWLATAASIAVLTDNDQLTAFCRQRFKEVLLPSQMATDGSFPLELDRTKPYAYSLFNIDAFANVAQILSSEEDNLWAYETTDGKSLKKGLAYIYPFIKDKELWMLPPDINIWDNWPACHSSLLFAAFAFDNEDYLQLFLSQEKYPSHPEVRRNLPIRHPLIWLGL